MIYHNFKVQKFEKEIKTVWFYNKGINYVTEWKFEEQNC